MSILSIPNVFVTGTTIQAAPFNANFNAVVAAVNNIDNSNIGAAGLYASNLTPTSVAQATFGSALGYIFQNSVSLSAAIFTAGATGAGSQVWGGLDGASNGLVLNVPTASTNGYRWLVNNSTVLAQLTTAGSLLVGPGAPTVVAGDIAASRSTSVGAVQLGGSVSQATVNYGSTANHLAVSFTGATSPQFDINSPLTATSNASTLAYVPPVYTNAGAALPSTTHIVCGTGSVSSGSPLTITLSGAAVFTSSSSYSVLVTSNSGSGNTFGANPISGSSFGIVSTAGSPIPVSWIAIGS